MTTSRDMATPIGKDAKVEGDIKIAPSILSAATKNNQKALLIMFKQFIAEDEEIYYVQYLGRQGIWGVGNHSFACLSECRVADITVGRFGEVTYQDGYLESINSSIIYQPSKLGLYFAIGFSIILAVPTIGISLLFIPFIVQGYYRLVKCGIVLWVKEGAPIYMFTNHKYLKRSNLLCRSLTILRENRLRAIKDMPDV
ncbi:hypothetical protein [Dapis sp. BLCC M172]|uniref:hypothetical protein n=1 Tax=Dapis sp. BLCC M172 TaxID=2975281 RepID=UPI003CE854D4